jgi:hypothetical protein
MAWISVRPTRTDRWVANTLAMHTNGQMERTAKALTWGADEHVICLLAAGWWLYCRNKNSGLKLASTHVLTATIASSLLPHLLKRIFDQERPDRETFSGHLRGIPFSGKKYDAFPSGHALHMGALASAATELPATERYAVWALCGGLVLTRIVLLAHWVSDVAVGLAAGVGLERVLRWVTGYGHPRRARPARDAHSVSENAACAGKAAMRRRFT